MQEALTSRVEVAGWAEEREIAEVTVAEKMARESWAPFPKEDSEKNGLT